MGQAKSLSSRSSDATHSAKLETDVFGTILISVVTLMHGYVFLRAASVPFVRRHVSQEHLIGVALALCVLFLLVRVIGTKAPGDTAAVLEFLTMTWMAILLLT